jgi:hypothetical protein
MHIDYEKIKQAIKLINEGIVNKVEINKHILVYKVPSQDENKYTIRTDIKIKR